jgi:predicted Zn-dependent protease
VLAGDLASQLPDIGTAGTSVLSPHEERLLGREFMRSIQQSLPLLDDPIATAYLQNLADRLVSQLSHSPQEITVFIVKDPSINAFAGPGGYIGVHTGLILSARTESELASVLAHEIVHVTQRHLVRSFESSSRMNLATMGALIAAIVLGANNPEASEAVLTSAVAGSAQQQLTYSRAHEQEADRIAMDLLANANFNPGGMEGFFNVLMEKQRITESSAPEFLRTHPLTLARIADARNRAQQYSSHSYPENPQFQLIQAHTAALTGAKQSPASRQQRLDLSTDTQQYFHALSLYNKGEFAQARTIMQRLLKSDNLRVLYHYSAAQIELGDQQLARAQDILRQALTLFPGNQPLTELFAETQLQLKQPQPAFDALQALLRESPTAFRLYPIYAKTASALGNKAEAYRALAEFHHWQGNIYQAIDYLNNALKIPNLPQYEQLVLEARLGQLKSEARENKREVLHPPN